MDLISVGRVLVSVATVTAYVLYFAWRLRKRRAQQGAKTAKPAASEPMTPEERLARTIATAARLSGEPPKVDVTAATGTDAPPPSPPMAPEGGSGAVDFSSLPPPAAPPLAPPTVTTVADVLQDIDLPNDLAPLTTLAPRIGAADRVAFWTNTSVPDVVGPAFLDALRAIGCDVAPLGVDTFALERDGAHAMVNVYADGRAAVIDGKPAYPTVPENAFVVEVWVSG